jgi:hypothetical protein
VRVCVCLIVYVCVYVCLYLCLYTGVCVCLCIMCVHEGYACTNEEKKRQKKGMDAGMGLIPSW